MTAFDPSRLTREERRKIVNRARRNVASEVTLILTAGFGLIMIVLFVFGKLTFLPLAGHFKVPPILAWIGLSVLISVPIGLVHGWLASSQVARARQLQFVIHQFDEAKKQAETKEKMESLKETKP